MKVSSAQTWRQPDPDPISEMPSAQIGMVNIALRKPTTSFRVHGLIRCLLGVHHMPGAPSTPSPPIKANTRRQTKAPKCLSQFYGQYAGLMNLRIYRQ